MERNRPEKGQGQTVVLDMESHLEQAYGTHNFFIDLELTDELLEKNVTLCGTLRRNKLYIYIVEGLLPARYKNFESKN